MNALPQASGPFGRTGPRPTRARRAPGSSLVIGLGAALLVWQLVFLGSAFGGRPAVPQSGPQAGPQAAPPALSMAELRTPGALANPVIPTMPTPALAAADVEPVAALAPVRPGGGVPPARPEAPPVDPSPAVAEQALELTRLDRRGVQRRLSLIGYDPHGIDGVFGPDTRAAISSWQTNAALAATGYLDPGANAALFAATDAPYRAWRARIAAGRRADETRRIADAARDAFQRREDGGCARAADGSVVARQSLVCDLTGMGEGMAGLVEALVTL